MRFEAVDYSLEVGNTEGSWVATSEVISRGTLIIAHIILWDWRFFLAPVEALSGFRGEFEDLGFRPFIYSTNQDTCSVV